MSKRKGFAICKCIFEKNIFLQRLKLHVTYKNDNQFLADYSYHIEDIDEALREAREEALRRVKVSNEIVERRDVIDRTYKPSFSEIFSLRQDIFQNDFLDLPGSTKSVTQIGKGLFTFPVFTREFCEQLVSELKHFKQQDLPHRQPNSMNRHGILLDDILKFREFFDEFRVQYLQPLARKFFPDMKDIELDSHKGKVQYLE